MDDSRSELQLCLSRTGFGTSGVRALVTDLTSGVVSSYTLAFVELLGESGFTKPGGRVLVGHDLRPSSPAIARAVLAALRSRGLEPVYAGTEPTPALAFHAMTLGIPAIVVTGSHIPFDRNGIKFYRPDGEILKDDEARILAGLTRSASPALEVRPLATLPSADRAAGAAYLARYERFFSETMLKSKRIGLFEHSSVARDLLRVLFERLGATVIPIERSDTFVAIDTEAVTGADQERANGWARAHGFDVLVSTDGDGDRPLIGDETGRYFRGDAVGILTARRLGARTVVTPVNASTALERSGWFEHVVRTRIGSPYVITAMMERASDPAAAPVAGFEANGGFLTATRIVEGEATLDPLPTRDSVLPMLALMDMAFSSGKPMSSLHGLLPPRHTASDRLQGIDIGRARTLVESLTTDGAASRFLSGLGMQLDAVDLTDGVRMISHDGRIVHLRMSGNAPEMRCYAETGSAAESDALAALALKMVMDEISEPRREGAAGA